MTDDASRDVLDLGSSPVRVLVVDDEPGVRALIVRWLREIGCTCAEAASAESGLAAFAREPAEIVLCDIALPDHDGHWLVERLKAADGGVAVVMVTGLRSVGPAVSSLQHGFADFLVKPFARERLREAITRALAWRRHARGEGPPPSPQVRRAPVDLPGSAS